MILLYRGWRLVLVTCTTTVFSILSLTHLAAQYVYVASYYSSAFSSRSCMIVLHASDIPAHLADAARIGQLAAGHLEAQVELLLLQLTQAWRAPRWSSHALAGFHSHHLAGLIARRDDRLDGQLL